LLKNVVFVSAKFQNNQAILDSMEKRLEAYGEKVVGIKVYFDTTVSDIQDIQPLCQVVEYAKKKDLRIMVHSSNSPVPMGELLEALRAGDILTHAYHGGKNNVSEDGFECIKSAKERGVIIDAGFAGHVHTDFKVFRDAIRYGAIPDVISTDITRFSAYKRGGRYGMTMCMNISKTLGMREEDIFRAVTSNPAKALGKDNEWGYLKVGRTADIAVFDYTDEGFDVTDKAGNHISNTQGWRCVLTISDGQVVYRN
jgi:dihydroorotase